MDYIFDQLKVCGLLFLLSSSCHMFLTDDDILTLQENESEWVVLTSTRQYDADAENPSLEKSYCHSIHKRIVKPYLTYIQKGLWRLAFI